MLIIPLLVLSEIERVRETGDGDLCYHNFECAYSIWVLRSFNNVISNASYVVFGFVYLFIVKNEILNRTGNQVGPCRHFGLLIAMGLTLITIGVTSGLYHVCPNRSSIEFDMAFIHVLLGLCMLKLFASRHGASEPHVMYAIVAGILVLTAISTIISHDGVIWFLFVILHFFVMPYLSMQVYYNGHIQFSLIAGKAAMHSFRNVVIEEFRHGHWRPLFTHRLVMLAAGNMINVIISVVAVKSGLNIQSYLFGFMLINLILYFAYYLFCKIKQGENLGKTTRIFVAAALLFWCAAVYFYASPNMDWNKTPAESRTLNKECAFLGFFDLHDLWHFSSGTALFFSLLAVMALDDGVQEVPRNKVCVF